MATEKGQGPKPKKGGSPSPQKSPPPNPQWFRWMIWLVLGFSLLSLYRMGSVSLEGGIPENVSYSEF